MIDDELLQELLGKASVLYNSGEYKSAIEAWKEALQVDPGSQKAREGIQMATLLLAGCEPAPEVVEEPEPAPSVDGAAPGRETLSPEELEARLDQGINRVRELLNARKYSEAVEGARSLVPMDPDSEEVQRLVEDAQQAFESAPFIEEHLTLARELASQDRFEEAESECRKVFALDRANPEAHTLIADLRRRARALPPQAPAARPTEIGGMTVKMDLSKMLGEPPAPEGVEPEPPSPPEAAAPEASAKAAKEDLLAEPLSSDMFDFELDLGATGPVPEAPAPGAPGPEESAEAPPAPAEGAPETEPEIVDADTVVPPSVRLVPRTEEAPQGVESWLENLDGSEPGPSAPSLQGKDEAPGPDAGGARGGPTSGWEQELESLNLQSGEHDILGRSAARTPSTSPAPADSDLSSFLGEDAGSPPAGAAVAETKPRAARPVRPRPERVPHAATHGRVSSVEAMREAPPPETGSRRSASMYFGLLGVVLLAAGGTVWWFYFQPRAASGSAPSAVTPPAAASGEKPDLQQGPIPTPIGSTSREPVKPPPSGDDEAVAVPGGVAKVEVPEAPDQVPAPVAREAAPPPRPKTPEELRSEVAHRMSEGRRFLAAGKWREARDEFAAVLALDPVNFQCKELLDQAQEHVNQDTKVRQDLEIAKSSFEEKNYQSALWKLYRLPRDPRLGDVDLYIRNAWFNWAVMGLKGGDATNASQKLAEALSADPNDAEAAKLQDVAQRYASKPKDRIYYSFVDTLKYRAFDQK